jgi:mannosyl-oligosaccharide alpha-1,2-mannosidase
MDDIWHLPQEPDTINEDDDRWADKSKPQSKPVPEVVHDEAAPWVTNEYGDKFRRQALPPMHPDLSLLPSPASLFPEVKDIASFLRPPTYKSFPDSRLRDIISDPPDEPVPDAGRYAKMPEDAYAKMWKAPAEWEETKGEMRKMQWEGFSSGREDTWETKEEGEVRKERRDAVKRGFVYAWQKYKDYAWGESNVI